ncbi:MAG TPA: amino acid ABC transporter substrate-binding protein [Burkholderiales bacterium]|nr:amino acid ABC transporter substrate-binding protein [Burkholderiales bacterium]
MKPASLLCFLLLSLSAAAAFADPGSATLDRIRGSGAIRLGYLESAAPFSQARGNEAPRGYSIDLCGRVADELRERLKLPDLRKEWVKVTLQDRLQAVKSGRIDLECGTTTWTLSRQQEVDFSLMTFVDGGSLLVKAESKARRMADFAGLRIAVVSGTTTQGALTRELARLRIDAKVAPVADERTAMAMLASGEADGYASDRLVLMGLALNATGSRVYRLIDEDFSIEPYALALRRGDPDFRLAVNRALARVYRSGEIMQIYEKWFGLLGRPGVLLSAVYVLQAVPE